MKRKAIILPVLLFLLGIGLISYSLWNCFRRTWNTGEERRKRDYYDCSGIQILYRIEEHDKKSYMLKRGFELKFVFYPIIRQNLSFR